MVLMKKIIIIIMYQEIQIIYVVKKVNIIRKRELKIEISNKKKIKK